MPCRRWLSVWLMHRTLQECCSTGNARQLISVENEKAEEESIDPDEYLWETLPGRCCFMEHADDCDMCNVWSDPQNFCHSSEESCELCGACSDYISKSCSYCPPAESMCMKPWPDHEATARSRNMLNYDTTEQASTRVYAVTHLDMYPPSPPGYERAVVKHFSILQDPQPPPPPSPPPSPPRSPPPPLPAALGTKTDTHIECEFYDGMDYSVVGVTGASTDMLADTKKHCCSQCGMLAGCTDFVYEPSSKTCVLMPPVPSYNLKRSPNNSTIAGSVTISRMSQHHGSCKFEVGSGYAGGAIGGGHPLPGKSMSTKQDCCDSCERDSRCAKFVFEHFSGDCQLFGPQAEKYYTFNLQSGTVDGRVSDESTPPSKSEPDQTDVGEEWSDAWDEASRSGESAPPVPPTMFSFGRRAPPPFVRGGDNGVASTVLEDFSLGIGFLIIVVFSLFAYLFFASDIQQLLYKCSGGRLGKQPSSLLPTQEPGDEMLAAPDIRRRGTLLPGWAKVTVQMSQVTQKKEVDVAGCTTLDDMLMVLWDEFGHLLKSMRKKDMLLLVWVAGHADDDQSASVARWELVTGASDMSRVAACTTMKFAEKSTLDIRSLTVAFTTALPDTMTKNRGGTVSRLSVRRPGGRRDIGDQSDSEATSQSDGDDEKPLCTKVSTPSGRCNARAGASRKSSKTGKGARSSGANERRPASGKQPQKVTANVKRLKGHNRDDIGEEDDDAMEVMLSTGSGKELLAKRVQVHSLLSRSELNGRKGVATSFDRAKGRYRVRLDAFIGGDEQTIGLKPENLRVVAK